MTRDTQYQCVHHLFETHVEQTPLATAVLLGEQSLTYRDLNRRANQLAHHLQQLGVGPEMLVGICVERSPEMIVGLLGILKAGAAYVPLDPAYPKDRLAFMLADSQVEILLTQAHLVDRLVELESQDDPNRELICLDSGWESIAEEWDDNPTSGVTADNLAYVLFTSGSTGKPKGAMIEHCQVMALLHGYEQISPAGERLAGTCVCPFGFDVSVWEFFSTLCFGGTLHVLLPSVFVQAERFADYLCEQQITSAYIPPALLSDVVGHLESMGNGLALDRILVGVEPIKQRILQRFRDLPQQVRVVNGYGPTETTICATFYNFQAAVDLDARTPIGTAVPGYEIHLVDQNLRPVSSEQVGEILIGGAGLGRGYWNRPALTGQAFILHPFNAEPGMRLYRTGDLAYYLPDGNIEFVGRDDHQIKIRGFRVELGEVEAALGQHPAVQNVVAIVREDVPGNKRLVAYVIPWEEQALTMSEMRRFLGDRLPDYMVPSALVTIESFPLTPNGKVDRRALPVPERVRPELDQAFVAPVTSIEEQLAEIWTEVLGFDQVGVRDNFFDLGGHSLALIQILARVFERFEVDLPVSCVFDAPTVTELARRVETAVVTRKTAPVPASIPRAPRDKDLRLAVPQEQIWFIQQLYPDIMPYNFQATLRLKGDLNVTALEHSLNEIVLRHEIYRTTFPDSDGRPVQIIHPPWQVDLAVVDLQEQMLQQWLAKELSMPFDITQLPLLRWTLLRLNESEHVLVHVEHHLVHDGWSFNVFLQELLELYQAFCEHKPSPLPEMSIQFADFAHWQQEWVRGEAAKRQLDYWREKLSGSPPLLELPTDHPRPATPSFRGAAPRVELPIDLCESLRAFSQREGLTLYMTMLGAFVTLLHHYSGQVDVNVGSAAANRRRRELESLIGMLINVLVLRTDLSGNPTFRELLRRVREVTLEAYAHQDLPFERVVEALQPERQTSYNPLFQVVFSFHDAPLPEMDLPGLEIEMVEGVSNESAKFDMNVVAIPRSEQRVGQKHEKGAAGITLVWEYSTDLFEASTIERIMGHYQTLLEHMVANPDMRLSDVSLLTQAERHQLLVEWNATETGYACDLCVHQLFERQAAKTPEAEAVVFGEQRLTYRELNRRANQLAHHLRGLGVGPEVAVCVCMNRSADMVVGLVGILKAGGAYVSLDPDYPQTRLAFMIKDTHTPVLLTQHSLIERLPAHNARTVCLDTDWDVIAQADDENPTSGAMSGNLVYYIYTSGSTGQPKGVQIEHASLLNLIFWHQSTFSISETDRATQVAGLTFDASVWELWPYLTAGATIYLPDEETRATPERLRDWLVDSEITISFLPTPLAEATLRLDWPAQLALRTLLTGGEKLHQYPDARLSFELVNNYGPTEDTVVTTSGLVPSQDQQDQAERAPSIGRPIANTQIYLLNPDLRPVPLGVVGELYVGGDGLARGYLDRPDLTAQAFIPNPFSSSPGARLYRTGDLLRYRGDGTLEFLERIDHQVKIRGFRIELGEIEFVLGQHETIKEAVVIVRTDVSGDKRLVAYLIPDQEPAPTVSELRHFLRDKLPEYMLPSIFVTLDTFPLTLNGKIDRRALPEPEQKRPELEHIFVPPDTPIEQVLSDVWSEILQLEKIGIHDNFFELGGHSLLATQVISRINARFEIELPLRVLFETSTIAELGARVEQALIEEIQALDEDEIERLLTES